MDINGSIEQIVTLVFGESGIGAAHIELALDRSIARVMGEQTGLEQVIVNLLMNARDAGADRIKIETKADPAKPRWVRIVVSDNGSGAPPEVIARVFEPFYTSKAQGTGLGPVAESSRDYGPRRHDRGAVRGWAGNELRHPAAGRG